MERVVRDTGGSGGSGVEVFQGAGGEVKGAVEAVAGLAGGVFGVADAAAAGADEVEEGVLLAVDADFEEVEGFAGGLALDPEYVAGGGPEDGGAGFDGDAEGGLVDVGEEDDFAGVGVLDGDGEDAGAGGDGFGEFVEVETELGGFFKVGHGRPPVGFWGRV